MREIHGITRELQAIQQAAKDATKETRADPEAKGRRLRVVFDPTATPPLYDSKTVSHGLGKKPVGLKAMVAKNSVQYTVGAMTTRTIHFDSFVGSGTIDFWVY